MRTAALAARERESMPHNSEDVFTVEFQPQGKRIHLTKGVTVMDAAAKAGLELASDCGGKGRCGRCRVGIVSGSVSPPNEAESATAKRNRFGPTDRLACRTELLGPAKVYIPTASMRGSQVLVLDGRDRTPEAMDRIESVERRLPQPSLTDQRSDLERLFDELDPPDRDGLTVHPRFVERLTGLIRSAEGSVSVFLRDGRPIGLGEPGTIPLGLAVDIGTTSIAARLVDLSTGRQIGAAGAMNPQISVGEDVISRLDHALNSPGGADELASLLRAEVNSLINRLCDRHGLSPLLVTDLVICANTAISHLLLKLPVAHLARAPYLAGFSSPLQLSATDLDLTAVPCARATIMPCIQGFIGGDHTAVILACDIDRAEETVLGVDIGTNTEIVLAKPGPEGGLFVASCASGPALEGAHIRDGMRAGAGAIEAVKITDRGPEVKTIGDEKPVGICGSGIIDAVAELLRAGLLDQRGHLAKDGPGVTADRDGLAYRLVPAAESGSGDEVLVTQKDVSEIQLAKAAIQAGVLTILESTGTPADQVTTVYLAGAFGSHIDIDNALAIGMLPELPRARFVQAGNAASVGALLALVSSREQARAARIARTAKQIELAGAPPFNHLLARGLRFSKPAVAKAGSGRP